MDIKSAYDVLLSVLASPSLLLCLAIASSAMLLTDVLANGRILRAPAWLRALVVAVLVLSFVRLLQLAGLLLRVGWSVTVAVAVLALLFVLRLFLRRIILTWNLRRLNPGAFLVLYLACLNKNRGFRAARPDDPALRCLTRQGILEFGNLMWDDLISPNVWITERAWDRMALMPEFRSVGGRGLIHLIQQALQSPDLVSAVKEFEFADALPSEHRAVKAMLKW